jgi:hypothetical protein
LHMAAVDEAEKRATPRQLEATGVPFKLEWNSNN